jgi:hypothetical protein
MLLDYFIKSVLIVTETGFSPNTFTRPYRRHGEVFN